MDEAMLEAHVRFEVDRWHGDGLRRTLGEELDALLSWAGTVALDDVLPYDTVATLARERLADPALQEPLRHMVAAALLAGRDAAADSADLTVADVLPRAAYDRAVAIGSGLDGVRDELLDQLTSSSVYSELLAHVLYQGVKRYVLQENVVARRVPGASSLLRLGQSAVSSVAPTLERSVDRQLTAFVNANIADTIRDSRSYLESALDRDVVRRATDAVWDDNAVTTFDELARLTGDADAAALADVVAEVVAAVVPSELAARTVEAALGRVYDAHGDRPVADLLDAAGVRRDALLADLVAALTPIADSMRDSGFLEQRIRARLEPFYASYPQGRPHRTRRTTAD